MNARRVLASDMGSTLPLVAGFGALVLAVALLVAAATSLYLEKKSLLALADGASLSAAESFELSDVELTPDGPRPTLRPATIRAAVDDYLERARTEHFDELAVTHADTADGRSATVTLTAYWRPPVATVFIPDGIRIEATSTARSVFG
ncbi:pilus assembly protein TadG-related protein [Homoserinibacter sp. GY 40078]|uniref:pilus assembly protein TadG-related protein n=1 Tax=Homoserinibacter sp. GY 40078 TaxID=2603275 RepID=UPI0011C8C4CB|nr:pilus assembly protein TadG-related protein [Homoserinibacter sp. GY 40078]TXK19792.1 hypothetical protein FVQ89_08010 [Homoserinibacter sp. GY 40078]